MNNSFPRTIAGAFLAAAMLIFAGTLSVRGQMGNDNPTGVSGAYNGNVNTAGSYDPYTGNATRSVTDITVTGAVGAYPLAFTRTMNSRYTSGTRKPELGSSGNWRHSYQWSIEPVVFQSNDATTKWTANPSAYIVNYPDGRELSFSAANGDTYFRGGPGISDRFQQLSGPDGGDCFVILPDGGKVWFQADVDREVVEGTQYVTSTFTFNLVGIFDPYGQLTTVGDEGDGALTVKEPAGRTLKLYYITTSWNGDTVLDRVVASDGRTVKYNYGQYKPDGIKVYTALYNVQYLNSDGSCFAQATYAYQPNNVVSSGRPLISWAIDPMYTGPMWAISYTFVPYSSGGVYGQLQSENYLDPTTGTPGQVVSSLFVNGNSRTETRGDGPSRTFNYSGGKLVSYADFKGQPSSISYDGNGFVWAFTDARGHTTTTSREGTIGAVSVLTHPDAEHSTRGYTYWSRDGGPYFSQIRGDERGHSTYFTRDPNNFRLTRIDYPDYPNGAYEEFTYDPYGFGKVATHKRSSGGAQGFAVDTFSYDGRGMMWALSNADGTAYYYYDSQDRLEHVVDRRGTTTWYEYNARGQVTRVTHIDGSYSQYGYNGNGTLAWSADENHPGAESDVNQRTRYAYDDYKRVVSVTNPLNQTTSFVYAQDWSNSYNQTTTNLKGAFSPMNKPVHFAYDENWQRTITRIPPGADPNDAWTFYGYDAAGNLTWTQDPRGSTTTFDYDERNRKIWMDDPIASDRNSRGHTMTWDYDTTSNLRFETRADDSRREWLYDSMNRVYQTTGFMGEGTGYGRDLAGNVTQLTDAKGASYYFGYDALNRKTSATYPTDATNESRTETWQYDAAGNMNLYKNPAGTYRHLFYDDHNRLYDAWWDNYAAPEVVVGYDAASRVTSIVTNTAQITAQTMITFGYDDANRKIWEDQTLSGYPTRRVNTPRDTDGNPLYLDVAGYYHTDYAYTQRNQLASVNCFAFTYDASGNMTNRTGTWFYQSGTNYSYDELNRVTQIEQGNAWYIFARSHYQYDSLNHEVATWRDEQSSKGERFGYNAVGQLTTVAYNADQVWTGNPLNATRNVSYTLDALNRQSVTDNGTVTGDSPNAMNQYEQWSGQSINYDGNFNFAWIGGWQYNYDAENHLTSIGNGSGVEESFVYDGLGRCVKRTLNTTATLYTYDGWKPMLEWDGSGNWLAWNIYGAGPDEILARYDSSGRVAIYKQDQHGNVVAVLDQSGDVTEKYTYDAFGKPSIFDKDGNGRTGTAIDNRFLFQGREWYPEIGLYNFRNRFYDPTIGRFIQPDPLGFGGGDANLFRYCGGDPVNRRDPFGLWSPPPTQQLDAGGNDYYGNEPYPDNVSESNPLEGIDESNMDRVTIGGPPEPGTTLGPGDFARNGNPPGEAAGRPGGAPGGKPGGVPGGRPGHAGRSGISSARATGHVPNPYLSSGPLIADVWKGFDGANMGRVADAFTYGVAYPAAGAVALPVAGAAVLDLGVYYFTPGAILYAQHPDEINEAVAGLFNIPGDGPLGGSTLAGQVGTAINQGAGLFGYQIGFDDPYPQQPPPGF